VWIFLRKYRDTVNNYWENNKEERKIELELENSLLVMAISFGKWDFRGTSL